MAHEPIKREYIYVVELITMRLLGIQALPPPYIHSSISVCMFISMIVPEWCKQEMCIYEFTFDQQGREPMNFMDVYIYTYVNIDRPQCITHVPGKTIATIDAYIYIYIWLSPCKQTTDARTHQLYFTYIHMCTLLSKCIDWETRETSAIYIYIWELTIN